MMNCYCLACSMDFETDVITRCPHCGATADEIIIEDDEESAPTEEELEAMFADYNERNEISNPLALIGAQ